jgi:hypothetical protein
VEETPTLRTFTIADLYNRVTHRSQTEATESNVGPLPNAAGADISADAKIFGTSSIRTTTSDCCTENRKASPHTCEEKDMSQMLRSETTRTAE